MSSKSILSLLLLFSMASFSFEYDCRINSKKAYLKFKDKSLKIILDNSQAVELEKKKSKNRQKVYGDIDNTIVVKLNRKRNRIKEIKYSGALLGSGKVTNPKCVKSEPGLVEEPKQQDPKPNKSKIFKEYGRLTQIQYRPINSPLELKYDVLYYIPKKLKGKTNLKTLVFLHGGGASTTTREGSIRAIKLYSNDMIKIAEELELVLIFPSGSGMNWGGQMIDYLKDLNRTIMMELPVDPTKIALTGHSMGGMGITRSAHLLTDEYAFIMPVAAGMDEKGAIEKNLRTYFNMNYYHLQGLNDHFRGFITRCRYQKKQIDEMEEKFGKKTGFVLEFHKGGHNYPLPLYKDRLRQHFEKYTKNFYQKELYGLFSSRDMIHEAWWTYGNKVYLGPLKRYFWLEVKKFKEGKFGPRFTAKIDGNSINIDIEEGVEQLRVNLTSEMVNLNEPVEITVNGQVVSKSIPTLDKDMTEHTKQDKGYLFDTYIDVSISGKVVLEQNL